jgi:protein involved in polysaccharide export with SLBB domain
MVIPSGGTLPAQMVIELGFSGMVWEAVGSDPGVVCPATNVATNRTKGMSNPKYLPKDLPKCFMAASATTHSLSHGSSRGNVSRRALLLKSLLMALGVLIGVALASGSALSQTSYGFGGGSSGSSLGSGGSAMDLQKAQNAARNGLSDSEMDSACQAAVSKHMSTTDVDALARTLGMSPAQSAQFSDCVAHGGPTPSNAASNGSAALNPLQAPTRPLETSSIESRFHELDTPFKLLAAPKVSSLEQFGYDLFATKVSSFAPTGNVPVGDDYIVGPDDELNVYNWGRVNQTVKLKVDRDGSVMVPDIGPIQIGGLTFGQAKKLIEGRMSQITGVEVGVTMGQVRTIQVFVIGKVEQPGLYTVSALSHVSNVLGAAGGISKMGSLRKIELRRDDRVAMTIDLYDFLLHGDTKADVRLKPRDVIFVPVIGAVAAVTGDVKSPAIYEMLGNESLGNLLRMAGGVTAFGYSERVQVERVQNHEKRVSIDVNLNRRGAGQTPVYDGDLVKVFTILPIERNVVRVKGNVNQPGTYQWHPGMKVADLIAEAQGLANYTFYDYALLERRQGVERRITPLPINLGEALSDRLGADDLDLKPDDNITVYSQSELAQIPTVSIDGQVRKPGKYPLVPGMTARELIYTAGGLLDNASRDRAELLRTEIADGSVAHYTHMDLDLRQVLDVTQSYDVALKPSDEVLVQEASNWHRPWHVVLEGQVNRPGPYPIREGERLATVLRDCGGFRPEAYPRAAVFVRKSVQKIQQDLLDQARTRLQQDMVRLALLPHQAGQGDTSSETLAAIREILTQSQNTQATGRVVVKINSLESLESSPENIVLENEDRLVIPIQPAAVQVLGEVYNPNAIVYQRELRVQDYLQKAGGATEGGDTDHIYVIKADGSVLTDEGVRQNEKNRLFPLLPSIGGGLMEQYLEPGDTVYVPERLIYISSLQYAKDMTSVVANSALGLATLGILASTL